MYYNLSPVDVPYDISSRDALGILRTYCFGPIKHVLCIILIRPVTYKQTSATYYFI